MRNIDVSVVFIPWDPFCAKCGFLNPHACGFAFHNILSNELSPMPKYQCWFSHTLLVKKSFSNYNASALSRRCKKWGHNASSSYFNRISQMGSKLSLRLTEWASIHANICSYTLKHVLTFVLKVTLPCGHIALYLQGPLSLLYLWRRKCTHWINIGLGNGLGSCNIVLRTNLQNILQPSLATNSLKFTYLKFH